MKKKITQKLSKRLTQYSALTAAFAGIVDTNGQIVYTDVTDVVRGAGQFLFIDLDNSGSTDIIIEHSSSSGANRLRGIADTGRAFLGYVPGAQRYPFALDFDTVISSGVTSFNGKAATWNGTGQHNMNLSSCTNAGSSWCGVTDKYLGLRITISGNLHYGWARFDVNADASTGWVLKDYAYNTVPNESIRAGQQVTLGIDDNILNNVKIITLNKSIALYNLPHGINYKLYDMSGKIVLDGITSETTYVIEANNITSGIYVAELTHLNSNAVIKKKVIL